MNPLNVFKILFNCKISDNKLVLPNDFNLLSFDKRIRELTYQYFKDIENKIKLTKIIEKIKTNENSNIFDNKEFEIKETKISPLTSEDIANAIANDPDFSIIPDTISPEFYYSKNIPLTKYFKFDYDFMQTKQNIPKYAVKYKINETEFWNINKYLSEKYITVSEASKIKHSSEVINFDYLIQYPDLFDLDIIYRRFKKEIKPMYFKTYGCKKYYIFKILNEFKKEAYTDEYFISDYEVLIKLFECKTKRLPYNFDEIVNNLNDNSDKLKISNLYVKWLITHYYEKYIYSELLMKSGLLNLILEKRLLITSKDLSATPNNSFA